LRTLVHLTLRACPFLFSSAPLIFSHRLFAPPPFGFFVPRHTRHRYLDSHDIFPLTRPIPDSVRQLECHTSLLCSSEPTLPYSRTKAQTHTTFLHLHLLPLFHFLFVAPFMVGSVPDRHEASPDYSGPPAISLLDRSGGGSVLNFFPCTTFSSGILLLS